MAVAAGALAVGAAIAVISSRLPAVVAVASALVLVGVQLLAQPPPDVSSLAGAAVGAALAAEILWLGLRGRRLTGTSSLGWPAIAFLAAAGSAVGFEIQRVAPGTGSREALATGVSLAIVAAVAAAGRPDGVALGLSALVFTAAARAMHLAFSGPATPLLTVILATLGIALAACVALLAGRPETGDESSPRASARS
jgi:hypothetical protein